jgi:tetratricopeptide (TPR) repeat protein
MIPDMQALYTPPVLNTSPQQNPVPRLLIVLLLLGLCALTVFIYWPGLSGDYMFDDRANLLRNHRLNITSFDIESLQSAALSSSSGELRRPVSMLSFAINRYYFGIAPWSHKLVNLGIHILTGVLLFVFTRQIIRASQHLYKTVLPDAAIIWLPLAVTGLWLVHPLNLTSVLYIVQRMTSLATLFMVGGLCLYTTGRLRMLQGRRGMPYLLTGLFGCGALAVFSKETGALLPLYMLIIEAVVFRFRNMNGQLDKAVTGLFVVCLLVPGLLVMGWLFQHPEFFTNGYKNREFTLDERLLTEARVLLFYLKMIVMPSINELGLYHDDIVLSKSLLDPPGTLLALLCLLALLTVAVVMIRKQPLFSLGILWFFCGHLLESTAIALEIAHEHRNYLADFGILLALCSLGAQVRLPKLRRLMHSIVPVLFLLLFSITTWVRAGEWSDNINHAIFEARHHPNSVRAVYSAGRIHARLALEGVPGAYEKAQEYLERASRIDDSDIMASIVLIKLGYLTDNPVKDRWLEQIYERLPRSTVKPTTLSSLYELANCMNGSCTLPHEAMERMFRLTLENESLASNSRINANAHTLYGYFTINVRGNFEKGRELFHRAAELEPDNPQWHINLVNLLAVMGNYDEAEKQLEVFMATDTQGGGSADYQELRQKIDDERQAHESSSVKDTQDNG